MPTLLLIKRENLLLFLSSECRRLAQLLVDNGQTVTTVESCTGGGIACALTAIAGSSSWFNQGWVTYSNDSKVELVGVSQQSLTCYGAVSPEVVTEMAEGALVRANADWSIATSGIAGPSGGTTEKPVGTVWFGFAAKQMEVPLTIVKQFDGDRDNVRQQAINFAVRQLIEILEQATA